MFVGVIDSRKTDNNVLLLVNLILFYCSEWEITREWSRRKLKSYHESINILTVTNSILHFAPLLLRKYIKAQLSSILVHFFFKFTYSTQNGVSTSIILSGDVRTDTILSFIFDKNDISGYKANKSSFSYFLFNCQPHDNAQLSIRFILTNIGAWAATGFRFDLARAPGSNLK